MRGQRRAPFKRDRIRTWLTLSGFEEGKRPIVPSFKFESVPAFFTHELKEVNNRCAGTAGHAYVHMRRASRPVWARGSSWYFVAMLDRCGFYESKACLLQSPLLYTFKRMKEREPP